MDIPLTFKVSLLHLTVIRRCCSSFLQTFLSLAVGALKISELHIQATGWRSAPVTSLMQNSRAVSRQRNDWMSLKMGLNKANRNTSLMKSRSGMKLLKYAFYMSKDPFLTWCSKYCSNKLSRCKFWMKLEWANPGMSPKSGWKLSSVTRT